MTIGTLIEYLQFFDSELEVKVAKQTRAKIPLLDPWKPPAETEVAIPILCAPTFEIERLVHDTLTRNAPVLLVI